MGEPASEGAGLFCGGCACSVRSSPASAMVRARGRSERSAGGQGSMEGADSEGGCVAIFAEGGLADGEEDSEAGWIDKLLDA